MQATSLTAEQQRISKEFAFPSDADSLVPSRLLAPYCSKEAAEIDIFVALQGVWPTRPSRLPE